MQRSDTLMLQWHLQSSIQPHVALMFYLLNSLKQPDESGLMKEPVAIVNNSLQTGIFPKALKTAVIKPLLKSLDTAVLYCHLTLNLLLATVIKKIVHQQLSNFLIFMTKGSLSPLVAVCSSRWP